MIKIPVIIGATASGKTALAIDLAQKLNAEIISADSRQVYRELTIGSAKPSEKQLAIVPHHFINERNVIEKYNAAEFAQEAWKRIYKIFELGKKVLVVGGSTLYVKSLVKGFSELPDGNATVRRRLYEEMEKVGSVKLYERLQQLDEEHAKTLDHTKTQRLIRSLEVIEISGKKMSDLQRASHLAPPFQFEMFGIDISREELYERINRRVDEMINSGFLDEARKLHGAFSQLHKRNKINALETVGYKELFEFIDGKMNFDEAVKRVKQHTRNYAKRQLTFFRRQFEITWAKPSQNWVSELVERKRKL